MHYVKYFQVYSPAPRVYVYFIPEQGAAMNPDSQQSLKHAFNAIVKSDIAEWKTVREVAGAKGVVIRDFEHASTKDRVQAVEICRYDPVDEMNVTTQKVTGTFRGREVRGTLLYKPEID